MNKAECGYENDDPSQPICHKKNIVIPGEQNASLARMNQETRPK